MSLKAHAKINTTKDVQTKRLLPSVSQVVVFQNQDLGSVLLLFIKLSGNVPRNTCRNRSLIAFPLATEVLPTLLSPSTSCETSEQFICSNIYKLRIKERLGKQNEPRKIKK